MSFSSSPVTRDAVSSAVSKCMQTRSSDSTDDFLALQLSLRFIPGKLRVNPFLLSLPHPLPSLSVCLITDDRPNCPAPSSFLDKARELNIPVTNSIGFSVLRSDFKVDAEKLRVKLKGSYEVFLAEKRILPLLVKLLGKGFFGKKSLLPVNFSRPGWPEQIKRILSSTCFYLKSASDIRVGRLCMGVEEIVDNVMRVIDEAVDKVPNEWEHVLALHLKVLGFSPVQVYQAFSEIGLKAGEKENLESGEVLDEDEGEEKEKTGKKGERMKGEHANNEKKKKQDKDGEVEEGIKKKKGENEGADVKVHRKKEKKDKFEGKNVEMDMEKKNKEENKGGDVKVKDGKKGKKDKLEGQNLKVGIEKMKKRSKGEMVEVTEKKGKRIKN